MIETGVKPITTSLLLSIVIICLMVLSALTVSTAAADVRLAEKYAESVKAEYALEAQAQEWLAEFESALKRGEISGPRVKKTIGSEDERHISVVLEVDPVSREYRIAEWKQAAPDFKEGGIDGLWTGNAE